MRKDNAEIYVATRGRDTVDPGAKPDDFPDLRMLLPDIGSVSLDGDSYSLRVAVRYPYRAQ